MDNYALIRAYYLTIRVTYGKPHLADMLERSQYDTIEKRLANARFYLEILEWNYANEKGNDQAGPKKKQETFVEKLKRTFGISKSRNST